MFSGATIVSLAREHAKTIAKGCVEMVIDHSINTMMLPLQLLNAIQLNNVAVDRLFRGDYLAARDGLRAAFQSTKNTVQRDAQRQHLVQSRTRKALESAGPITSPPPRPRSSELAASDDSSIIILRTRRLLPEEDSVHSCFLSFDPVFLQNLQRKFHQERFTHTESARLLPLVSAVILFNLALMIHRGQATGSSHPDSGQQRAHGRKVQKLYYSVAQLLEEIPKGIIPLTLLVDLNLLVWTQFLHSSVQLEDQYGSREALSFLNRCCQQWRASRRPATNRASSSSTRILLLLVDPGMFQSIVRTCVLAHLQTTAAEDCAAAA